MSYTEEETRTAALRIVTTPSYGSLPNGTRNSAGTFEQLQELVKTALFYDVDTVFYLISLAAGYYGQRFSTLLSILDDLCVAVDDLKNPTRAVEDVSDVTATRRSLDDVYSALTRDGGISSQTYNRFDTASQRSRDKIGASVKLNRVPYGSTAAQTFVARPGIVARPEVAKNFKALLTEHVRVLEGSTAILNAFSEYLSSEIWKTVARSQVMRARDDAAALEEELAEEATRLEKAQDAVLRLSTMRAVLLNLYSAPTPGSDKYVCDATSRLIATGVGTPPTITGTMSAPWRLVSGVNSLLSIDVGGTPVDVDVVTASTDIESASLTGYGAGPFAIGPDLAAPYPLCSKKIPTGNLYSVNGKTLYLVVDGAMFSIAFAADSSAATVASRINAVAGSVVTATAQTVAGEDYVEVEYDVVGGSPTSYSNRFMRISHGVNDATDLGSWRVVPDPPASEITSDVSSGHDANNELRVHANYNTAVTTIALTSGAWPSYSRTASQVAANITAAGGGSFIADVDTDQRVVITSSLAGDGSIITMRSAGVVAGRDTPSKRALQTLGFTADQESRKFSIPLQSIVNTLNGDAGFSALAQAAPIRSVVLRGTATVVDSLTVTLPLSADPSWSVLTDKTFVISTGDNAGSYGVDSYSWAAGVVTLVLSRTLRTAVTSFPAVLQQELLQIASIDASSAAYLDVAEPAGSAHTTLGLTTDRTYGTVSEVVVQSSETGDWLGVDLRRRTIRVGDEILEDGVVVATITSISAIDTGLLGVTPVDSDTVLTDFVINSAAYRTYTAFIDLFTSWFYGLGEYGEEELKQISRSITWLMTRKPSVEQIDSTLALLSSYRAAMDNGLQLLNGYRVTAIDSVDTALQTMLENGHDRARDMLLQCRFVDFVAMTIRNSSYSRAFMNAASAVVVNDANEPTMHRDPNATEYDRAQGGVITLEDPQFDFETEAHEPDSQLLDFWPAPVVK